MKLLKLLITLLSFSTLILAGSPKELPYLIFSKEIPKKTFTLNEAKTYCEEQTLYGVSDWRLPNSKELRYLTTKKIQNGKQGVNAYLEKEILDLLPVGSVLSFWSASTYESKVVSFNDPLEDVEIEPLDEANTNRKHQLICVHPKPLSHCYRFNKEDFNETLGNKEDLIVEISDLLYDTKQSKRIYLSFAAKNIPYSSGGFNFCCSEDEPGKYSCSGDCDTGRMQLRLKKDTLYLHIDHATMGDTPDDPITHSIASKDDTFSKGVKSVCLEEETLWPEKINLQKTLEDELLTAAQKGDLSGVKRSLEKGAKIDAKNNHKNTALFLAIKHLQIVKYLLNNSANINIQGEFNMSILDFAVIVDDLETIQLLIDKGADVSLADSFGSTPLYSAVEFNSKIEIVELLLKKGADIDAKKSDGSTPFSKAIERSNLPMVKLFIKHNNGQLSKNHISLLLKACDYIWGKDCKLFVELAKNKIEGK